MSDQREPETWNLGTRNRQRWQSATSYYGFLPDGGLWVCDDGFRPELHARLCRLQPEVRAALERQGYAGALSLTYETLEALAYALRPVWADALPPDQALIQALLVEVERCPLVALEDMTLQELQGTAIWVSHRAWATTREEALAMARRMAMSLGCSAAAGHRPLQVITWTDRRLVAWSSSQAGTGSR